MRRKFGIHAALAAGMAAGALFFAAQAAGAHPDHRQAAAGARPAEKAEASGYAHAGMLANAAEVLKIDRDELRRELKEGKTLAEIAAKRGVAKEELIRRLAETAAKRIDARVAEGRLDASRAERLKEGLKAHIEAAVDSRDLLRPVHLHPGHRFLLHKVASVLGMSKDELRSQLAEGRSIAEIAKSRGLSEDRLIGKLKDSLTDELRQFVRMKPPVRRAPEAKTGARP